MIKLPYLLSGYSVLPEPALLFNGNKQDIHPLRGLKELGPYSHGFGPARIKLAYIAPQESMSKLDTLVTELNHNADPKEGLNYYIPYPGFQNVFRIPLIEPADNLKYPVPTECLDLVRRKDGAGLTSLIVQSVDGLLRFRDSFDVLIIYLPRTWEACFEYEGFDLHDQIKAKVAPLNITIQILNDLALERKCRANVMWGISVAIYAKAGGIPWKLAEFSKDEAYIGLGYAIKKRPDGNEYSTCCSQVFDPDGTGFEFVAYDTREYTTDIKGNPYLSYQEMQSVLSRSLLIYQNGHRGHIPRKMFIHKTTHFTEDEIQGALDSFGGKTELELVQVIQNTSWYGLKIEQSGNTIRPTNYPIDRGLYLPISENECLLWTQGSVMGVNVSNPGQPVFKEAPLKPLPSPIVLRRFSGAGGWHDTCSSIFALTKVDWNNNTLYKTLPVTIGYSQVFANVIKQSPDIVNDVYDYRFFM
jgi:hypothetical protein